jgi:hypothetical protein
MAKLVWFLFYVFDQVSYFGSVNNEPMKSLTML